MPFFFGPRGLGRRILEREREREREREHLILVPLFPFPPTHPGLHEKTKQKQNTRPGAIADAKKWARSCSSAANAIADALAAGKGAPTEQELIDLAQQEAEKGDKKGGDFTIGAPLALVALAGLSIHRGRVDGSFSALVPTCPAEHAVSLVIARHRWFDAAMIESLDGEGYGVQVKLSPVASSSSLSSSAAAAAVAVARKGKRDANSAVRVEISPRGALSANNEKKEKIEQVVLLGSGMDARAWRLPLKEGNAVAWFDLDSGPVYEIKRTELESAGAELVKNEDEKAPKPRFPLKAKSYACVGCDMSSGDWVEELKAAGFDPSKPALFAAEGVIWVFILSFFLLHRFKKK